MRTRYWTRWCSLALGAMVLLALSQAPGMAAPRKERFLVKPQRPDQIAAIASQYGARVVKGIPDDGLFVLEVRTNDPDAVLSALEQDPRVFEAQGDDPVQTPPPPPPSDPSSQIMFAFDIGPDPMGYVNQAAFAQINLFGAHQYATGAGVRVAVLDTGVDLTHPDLAGRLGPGYNAIDPSLPPDDVVEPDKSNVGVGHGTMVAGIIAVIAPEATILPVKVLDADGLGRASDVIEGIYWAIRNQARVINMSFGAPSSSKAIRRAIQAARVAGIVLVASAGNAGTDVAQCPAALPGVIAVSSVEEDNTKSPWAAYGPFVDLVAPGNGIRSTFAGGVYATWSGTSFTAAMVSGAAALVRELRPHGGANAIEKILERTATSVDDVNPDYAGQLGSGLLNVLEAVRRVR